VQLVARRIIWASFGKLLNRNPSFVHLLLAAFTSPIVDILRSNYI
jgi:hypothetical protein